MYPVSIALFLGSEAPLEFSHVRADESTWTLKAVKRPSEFLDILNFDNPVVDCLIVEYSIFNDLSEASTLLRRVRQMDPDLPVFVVAERDDTDAAYSAGRSKSQVLYSYELDDIQSLVARIERHSRRFSPSFDISQRQLANQVADRYEQLETERPGTVAYWLFEEELLSRLVKLKQRAKTEEVLRVLDVGCGTGRLTRTILHAADPELVRLYGVDISGRMLFEAFKDERLKDFERRFRFQRGLAEKLPQDEEFNDFDVVVQGFGFPCYSPTSRVINEAHRVLTDDGILVCSIYNHNALAYERWRGPAHENDPQCPISSKIDREKGELWISTNSPTPGRVAARTFTVGHFARELRRAGFKVLGYLSFPVLYSVLSCTDIARWAEEGRREDCYNNARFSFKLWELDKIVSRELNDRGYYSIFFASKTDDVRDIAAALGFLPVDALES